ncbi:MAG: argininosuccinate synthase [Planctomycetota bacterium]|jgi:argininosuccinate synthase
MKKFEKIILAYSGGLDTSVAIPWLKEKTGAEIIAVGVNVGQPDNLCALTKQAYDAGACDAFFLDAKEEFVNSYIIPTIKANALYEGVYPLLSALSRPLIVEKLISELPEAEADAVAHGCTGKGNDQVRFEMALAALAPDLPVLAPARHWGFTRDDSFAYAKEHGLELPAKETPYSIDENLWGRAIECGILEDAMVEPPEDAFKMTVSPVLAPDNPEVVTIGFEEGVPVSVNGTPMEPIELISELNKIAGLHGIGRIDHIESRVVGIKSREVYEAPAAMTLITAHKALEAMVLTREEAEFKAQIDSKWANLVYEGKWHAPIMKALNAFIETTQKSVNGIVKLKMFKGGLHVIGRTSPNSLYSEGLATYGEGDPFDHAAADGFIKICTMETATLAKLGEKKSCAHIEEEVKEEKALVPAGVALA